MTALTIYSDEIMRRRRADWMNPADDEILEIVQEQGAATPKFLSDKLDKNNDYLGTRCRKLESYGLLQKISRGMYTLTEKGNKYLNGDLDANRLDQ